MKSSICNNMKTISLLFISLLIDGVFGDPDEAKELEDSLLFYAIACVVLLGLVGLVELAIIACRSGTTISGLRQIIALWKSTGDKRGIRTAVFHYVVQLLMLVMLAIVVNKFWILISENMEDKFLSLESLAFSGILLLLLFFTALKEFYLISQQKQRGIRLGVLYLLLLVLLMLLNVVWLNIIRILNPNLMEGHVAEVFIFLLALMFLGVIRHFSVNSYLQLIKVQKMAVFEGESVFLPTGFTELESDDVIELSFKNEVIAEFNKDNLISIDKERFRNRLQVDAQTGSLTIRNMRKEDAGLYQVKMSSSSKVKSFFQFFINGGSSYSQFNVIVYDAAGIRKINLEVFADV